MIQSLQGELGPASEYTSSTQIARVVSEYWCANNLYCAACDADRLDQALANTKAVDFRCANCPQTYQIKSRKTLNLHRIVDGAYSAMLAAMQETTAPNLVILHYSQEWVVQNLVLVPALFFTESVLQRRAPLKAHSRRAGWVGCNIVLSNVPTDGKISMVENETIIPANVVRSRYGRYKKLANLEWDVRGWTLDVLKFARKMGEAKFSLAQIYSYEEELRTLHPQNRNIRPKIRQQLQLLRDLGILQFLGRGQYQFVPSSPLRY